MVLVELKKHQAVTSDSQLGSNRQTALTNADIDYKNRAVGNDAISKMFQLESNKELADTTAMQNLLLAYGQNKQLKDQKLKYENYYKAATDPSIKAKAAEYTKLQEDMAKAKADWEKEKASNPNITKSTWEEDSSYKDFSSRIKAVKDAIEQYQTNLRDLSLSLQMPGRVGYPTYAKGGSLAEKKEIIRYTSEIKRNNADVERTFKMILKNNELMQKSLIKIFK